MNILNAMWAESLKIRRSRIIWVSLIVSCLLPVLLGLIMSGLVGDNSAFEGKSDLRAYLDQLGIVVSMGGLIGFGFVFSWVFGREYSDRTAKDLLALPISRSKIAAAKLIIAAVWCTILALLTFGFGCFTAWFVQMDGMVGQVVVYCLGRFIVTAYMVICLSMPVAWSASVGRGYLNSLGFVLLTIVAAQLSGAIGIADYFPWAIPGLFSGAAGDENVNLESVSFILPYATGVIGIVGTLAWWRFADQT
ncbi:ABC transporter permease [Paenibacillus sp. SI8]|uniref:ABC transporter permease n=1 Tax=unclassified Paenibacillus TaxID=185978 RepID=UPI003466670F